MENIKKYLDAMFGILPQTDEVLKAKNEIEQMMEDQYTELINEGVSEDEAAQKVISEFGNLSELAEELGVNHQAAETMREQMNTRQYDYSGTRNQGQYGQTQYSQAQYGQTNYGQNQYGQPNYTVVGEQKKSKSPLVILLVLFICLAIFISMFFAVRNSVSFLAHFFGNGNVSGISFSGGKSVTEDMDLDAFDKIHVEAGVGDVDIVFGDNYHVHYVYPENHLPEVKVENSTLTIKQVNYQTQLPDAYKLVITIPEGTKLESTYLDIGMDNVIIEDVDFGATTMNAGMGNIILKNCHMTEADFDAGMGNVELKECSFDTASFDVGMGNCELTKTQFTSATASVGMGNLQVKGSFDSLEADCSMGNLEVKNDNENASYTLDCDMGNLTVNGKNHGDHYEIHESTKQ